MVAAVGAQLSSGVDIPITAYILNVGPEVLSVALLDDRPVATTSLDPRTSFSVEVVCRDNNTVGDVLSVKVIIYSSQSSETAADTLAGHYTFSWSKAGGFSGGQLDKARCSAPGDLAVAQGKWIFRASLDRTARAGRWTILVTAQDEAESARRPDSFTVNKYTSFRLNASSIELAGLPGTRIMFGLLALHEANHPTDIGAQCSVFVGKQTPSVTLQPADFTLDDDPSLATPDQGQPPLTLSSSRQVLAQKSEGSGQMLIYIFVKIPDPFPDQDYQGKIAFDVRSR